MYILRDHAHVKLTLCQNSPDMCETHFTRVLKSGLFSCVRHSLTPAPPPPPPPTGAFESNLDSSCRYL